MKFMIYNEFVCVELNRKEYIINAKRKIVKYL